MIGHGLDGRNGFMVKRLNQHQLHVSLSRFQTISEKIDEGLKIFETFACVYYFSYAFEFFDIVKSISFIYRKPPEKAIKYKSQLQWTKKSTTATFQF